MPNLSKFSFPSLSTFVLCFALAQNAVAQALEYKQISAVNNNVSTSAARARVIASLNAQSGGRPVAMTINCRQMGHYMNQLRYECHGKAKACSKTGKRPLKRYRQPGPVLNGG